jgi:hypothetical protein
MKKELQADAELDWNALLEWISGQTVLEMFECDNDIDNNNTSKQNNDVSDNNNGGTQNMSEEKDRGKGFNNSSSSDDDEYNNQNDDDRDNANKEKVKGSIGEVKSDEENEWNEQGSTDGDKLIGSWGRRSMALAGEVTRHGRAHPYSWSITIVSLRSKESKE